MVESSLSHQEEIQLSESQLKNKSLSELPLQEEKLSEPPLQEEQILLSEPTLQEEKLLSELLPQEETAEQDPQGETLNTHQEEMFKTPQEDFQEIHQPSNANLQEELLLPSND